MPMENAVAIESQNVKVSSCRVCTSILKDEFCPSILSLPPSSLEAEAELLAPGR